jgi:hypothetical protein
MSVALRVIISLIGGAYITARLGFMGTRNIYLDQGDYEITTVNHFWNTAYWRSQDYGANLYESSFRPIKFIH